MKCPFCGKIDTKVVDSRLAEDDAAIRRRRQCQDCGARFTTYERAEPCALVVQKKDGRLEAFDPTKILNGLIKACEKRPVAVTDLQRIANEVAQELQDFPSRQIPSREIGELVMEKLLALDEVAYVRFASVYREFDDASGFVQEVETLAREGRG